MPQLAVSYDSSFRVGHSPPRLTRKAVATRFLLVLDDRPLGTDYPHGHRVVQESAHTVGAEFATVKHLPQLHDLRIVALVIAVPVDQLAKPRQADVACDVVLDDLKSVRNTPRLFAASLGATLTTVTHSAGREQIASRSVG